MSCECGHEYDEHIDGAECDVEDCLCVYFDSRLPSEEER